MSPEEYENQISLLVEALKFYGNIENYSRGIHITDNSIIPIELDNGTQARFALVKVQETVDKKEKMQEDYDKIINETIREIENHEINVTDLIKSFKGIK